MVCMVAIAPSRAAEPDGPAALIGPAEALRIAIVTRVADKADPVPDDVWNEAVKHYDDKALAGLLISISAINVWNRLNAATRQVAGSLGV